VLLGPDDLARRIEYQHRPGWIVWYGRRTREYWALAAWVRTAQALLGAATPDALVAAMVAFEAIYPRPWAYRAAPNGVAPVGASRQPVGLSGQPASARSL
jgi:hypothetical protein